jgi:hypothetical protein
MDNYTVIGGSLGIASIVISGLTYLNHKRVRSVCCGRKMEASLDVENTTPVVIPQIQVAHESVPEK